MTGVPAEATTTAPPASAAVSAPEAIASAVTAPVGVDAADCDGNCDTAPSTTAGVTGAMSVERLPTTHADGVVAGDGVTGVAAATAGVTRSVQRMRTRPGDLRAPTE
jgi:hypothetical protein